MRPRLLSIGCLLLIATLMMAQGIKRYEYWIDSDYSNRKSVTSSKTTVSLAVSTADLSPGTHFLNYRALNTDGEWGPLSRSLFYIPNQVSKNPAIISYEYWIDSNYSNRKTVTSSEATASIAVSTASLSPGTHFLNYRALNTDGEWGPLSRSLFYIPNQVSKTPTITSYEYWIDSNYSNRKTVTSSDATASIAVSTSSLSTGVHFLNYRALNTDGEWGPLSRLLFYNPKPTSKNPVITDYEYWLDDDMTTKVSTEAKDIYEVTVDVSNLKKGYHTFSFRAKNSDGEWGAVHSETFLFDSNLKISINKSKANLEKGKTLTLKATVSLSSLEDKSVTWKSSNTKVATVTSSGKVKGVKAGTATITCTSVATGLSATCAVTVGYVKLDQTEAVVKKGKTITLTPTVYPSSLTDKSVTWTSSNEKVATVTADGKVKGVKTGTATITCTSNATGLSRTCEVLVANLTLSNYELTIQKGKTKTLTATVYPSTLEDKSVTWESSNTKVATVSSTGKVKGVKAGTATITCTSTATGLSRTCKVTVGYVKLDQTEVSVVKGKTVTLTATVYPSSLEDKSVTWESSNTKIATVTTAGKVKGIKAGTATITCTSVATGLSTTCTVTVTATSSSRSADGDDDDTTGIENLENAPAPEEPYDVYDLSGRKVRHQVNSLDGLPEGVYIVNGKKILKKD